MPKFPRLGWCGSSTSTSIRRARLPVDWLTLRGARLRARELGILREFWELVSAGDFDAARETLALEQRLAAERARERRESLLSVLMFVVIVCVTAICWLLLDGL